MYIAPSKATNDHPDFASNLSADIHLCNIVLPCSCTVQENIVELL